MVYIVRRKCFSRTNITAVTLIFKLLDNRPWVPFGFAAFVLALIAFDKMSVKLKTAHVDSYEIEACPIVSFIDIYLI